MQRQTFHSHHKFNFLLIGVIIFLWSGSSVFSQNASEASLYERLGGYNAIAAVVDNFIGRLVKDEALSKFFVGHSTDSKNGMRQLIVDQLCAVTGGPCVYTGRSMKTSHDGLGITVDDWERSVRHLVDTLDKFKVPEKEKGEVLATASSLKSQIVQEGIDGGK